MGLRVGLLITGHGSLEGKRVPGPGWDVKPVLSAGEDRRRSAAAALDGQDATLVALHYHPAAAYAVKRNPLSHANPSQV